MYSEAGKIMKHNFKGLSLQAKMVLISLFANLLVFAVNAVMLLGIKTMSDKMDLVYQDNIYLNELSVALDSVQECMGGYLNTKTSDDLEDYYRSEQNYREKIIELNDSVSSETFVRMERNIKHMSEQYLEEVTATIDAKRGRNVEKYRQRYESATQIYDYIKTYIYSLNNEQFAENSGNYSLMLQNFRRFETASTLVMALVIVGNIGLILQLTYSLIKPLRDLKDNADEVARGNFDIEPLPITSSDEIGVVTSAFNQMVVSIQDYIEQVRKNMETEQELREQELLMKNHLKDAQLKYLQAQINPHFLFNTLNAGAQLAMMESADKTYEYVQRVAEFFRYNVKNDSQTVTLRDETELVDTYIYILNVRFSGDIHYEADIDKSLLDVEIPSMILQPIVENCVNHGIREMMGEGKITLKICRIDDVICITISDNGKGMTQETIDRIMKGNVRDAAGQFTNGIGMDNVIGRLKIFTGDEDCFNVSSDGPGMGTTFSMYISPRRKQS